MAGVIILAHLMLKFPLLTIEVLLVIALVDAGGSLSKKKTSSSTAPSISANKHSSIASKVTRGKKEEVEKPNGSVKSTAVTTDDPGDSAFDAEEAHIGHPDGNAVGVKARSKDGEKQKSTGKSSTDDTEKNKKKDATSKEDSSSRKSDSNKKDSKESGKEKSDGKHSNSSVSKAKTRLVTYHLILHSILPHAVANTPTLLPYSYSSYMYFFK